MALDVKHLCDVFDEGKRLLKPSGTCWVVMGDPYYGSGGNYGTRNSIPRTKKSESFESSGLPSDFVPLTAVGRELPKKSLCQIPARFAIEMCNRGWVLRNEGIGHKRNALPSSGKDRFTVDYEKVFMFAKSTRYHFQMPYEPAASDHPSGNKERRVFAAGDRGRVNDHIGQSIPWKPGGVRNRRCVWSLNTRPFPEAHFAVFPAELIETPIRAGCPNGGIVLDPFLGSGTTALVALRLSRRFIGIEMNPKYIVMAEQRIKGVESIKLARGRPNG